MNFQCWLPDDPDEVWVIEGFDAEEAAEKFVEHLDDKSGGEYSKECQPVEVTLMAPGGLPKRFHVALEARIHYDAYEVK